MWCEGCGQGGRSGAVAKEQAERERGRGIRAGEGGVREEEGAWGGAQGTDVLVCISLQDDGLEQSALHEASNRGLAGTVAQLLSLGADAALKDQVRACTCMRTWSYTYSMRVYSLGAYIRLCYKNRHIHTQMYAHIACVYIALARIFDYVTKTDTYTHKCIHIYVHQCLRYMYVIREIQVCLCVCMCMHVCMHLHIYTHIHTCVYVCTYVCICTFRFSGT